MTDNHQTIWIGSASLAPLPGSSYEMEGLKGGFGFVAVRATNIEEATKILRLELAEGGSELIGFEWLSRLEDYDQDLDQERATLVGRVNEYPVQFSTIHWYFFDDDLKSH